MRTAFSALPPARAPAPFQRTTCSARPPHRAHQPTGAPHPLSRSETSTLLRRMLRVALTEEDFLTAARIRDTQASIDRLDPAHALKQALLAAIHQQDFLLAARLRDDIERYEMLRQANRAKPRYPMGLVVLHRRLGYRMILFGVDFRCRAPGRKAEDAGVGLCERGFEQPWYHAAVDERDKSQGDNILYVAEDDVFPAPQGTEVRHPITRIMFAGLSGGDGYSWYIPGCRDDDD